MRLVIILCVSLVVFLSLNYFFTAGPRISNQYYLFDGNYSLNQNWYTEYGFFDWSECYEHFTTSAHEVCEISIQVKDNSFSFIDWLGNRRDCYILQNWDLPDTYDRIILYCNDGVYQVKDGEIDNSLFFQKYPLSSKYKIYIEPSINFFERVFKREIHKKKPIKNLSTRSERNNLLIKKYVNIDRNKTLLANDSRLLVYADDIKLSDGTEGKIAGQILGTLTCDFILGLDFDCSSIAGEIGAEAARNDGSYITQNLCISYDAIDSIGNIYEFFYICEKYEQPFDADFQSYVPRFFTNPIAKFNSDL